MDKTGIATIVFDEPVESVEARFVVAMDGSVQVTLSRSAKVKLDTGAWCSRGRFVVTQPAPQDSREGE